MSLQRNISTACTGAFLYIKYRVKPLPVEKLIYISLIGIIPLVLLSYPHIRYLARFYPLIVIWLLLFIQRLSAPGVDRLMIKNRTVAWVLVIFLVGVAVNLVLFGHNLMVFDSVNDFWFPD